MKSLFLKFIIVYTVSLCAFVTGASRENTDISRLQEPHPLYPYTVEEVSFSNNKDGTHLVGTLTHPNSKVEFPAVVLISGSGLQDRDETEQNLNISIKKWQNSLPNSVKAKIDVFTKINPDHWREMASEWATPYFKYVLNFDPYRVLTKIYCPVLSLIGEKNVQTLPYENSRAIKNAFENGNCKNYQVKIIKDVNHEKVTNRIIYPSDSGAGFPVLQHGAAHRKASALPCL